MGLLLRRTHVAHVLGVAGAVCSRGQMPAEEAAERLRGMLERNQRELSWHVARANGLLAKWAAQVGRREPRYRVPCVDCCPLEGGALHGTCLCG